MTCNEDIMVVNGNQGLRNRPTTVRLDNPVCMSMEHMMNLKSDLASIIKQQFDQLKIFYEDNLDVCSLAARYLEMLNRRVIPSRRRVHFSEEIHDSLGALRRKADMEQQKRSADAWGAVFFIRYLLTEGLNVNGFLSKRINFATGRRSRDGLLWDFGMHHFHLGQKFDADGFVKRNNRPDYLLFAILTEENAYFVDVKPHPNHHDLGWVRQDLLNIVHSNWPELIEPHILRGVKGTLLTDEEKAELRRKNCNLAPEIGRKAVAPLGGGTMADGSSAACRWQAQRLLYEMERHQDYFDTQPSDLRSALEDKGMTIDGEMEFDLVLLDDLGPPDELIGSLTEDQCLSKGLGQMGLAVVERTTRSPIVVSLVERS